VNWTAEWKPGTPFLRWYCTNNNAGTPNAGGRLPRLYGKSLERRLAADPNVRYFNYWLTGHVAVCRYLYILHYAVSNIVTFPWPAQILQSSTALVSARSLGL
jgi:hypothetical protein